MTHQVVHLVRCFCLDRTTCAHTPFIAHVPTIGDALDALDNLSSRLTVLFGQVTALSAELASEDRLRVDNIHEVSAVEYVFQ